jgi:hypothetical protein
VRDVFKQEIELIKAKQNKKLLEFRIPCFSFTKNHTSETASKKKALQYVRLINLTKWYHELELRV